MDSTQAQMTEREMAVDNTKQSELALQIWTWTSVTDNLYCLDLDKHNRPGQARSADPVSVFSAYSLSQNTIESAKIVSAEQVGLTRWLAAG